MTVASAVYAALIYCAGGCVESTNRVARDVSTPSCGLGNAAHDFFSNSQDKLPDHHCASVPNAPAQLTLALDLTTTY